ncbi:hypothetical protein AaE_002996, partial [Aphanomyces astaci]
MVRHDNEVREARFATKVAKKAAVAEARKRKIQTKQAEVQVRRAAKRPHYVGAAFVQVVAVKDVLDQPIHGYSTDGQPHHE